MRAFVAAAAVLLLLLTLPAAQAAGTGTVDDIVSSCPTAAQVASIDARLKVTFDDDPSAGTNVCGTTLVRANVYRTLLAMEQVQFSKPLPWTSSSLWDWFTHAIAGV